MNSNTRIKIRVPKSLYESVKNELKKEGAKDGEFGQRNAKAAMEGLKEDDKEENIKEYTGVNPALDAATLAAGGATAAAAAMASIVSQLGFKGTIQLVKDVVAGKFKQKPKTEEAKVQALAEAIKKVMQEKKKKKADAEKKKKEEEAEKKKKEAAMAKKKEAAKKK
jgi:colicin import membrane protein